MNVDPSLMPIEEGIVAGEGLHTAAQPCHSEMMPLLVGPIAGESGCLEATWVDLSDSYRNRTKHHPFVLHLTVSRRAMM